MNIASHKALLLGTALASTLLLGHLLAPAPAAADGILNPPVVIVNAAKLFDTLGPGLVPGWPYSVIYNTGPFSEVSSQTGGLGTLVEDLSNTIFTDITILNSGDIDPAIGIDAYVYNYALDLVTTLDQSLNNAGIADNALQATIGAQSNLVTTTIFKLNGGDITAYDYGIRARIVNYDIYAANNYVSSSSTIINSGDITGSLTQAAALAQSNIVESGIEIINSGDITDSPLGIGLSGIGAAISNFDIRLLNLAETSSLNSGGVGDNLIQSASVAQSNAIVNLIEIVNGGEIVFDNNAIDAIIVNSGMRFNNDLGGENLNSRGLDLDLSQRQAGAQSNAVVSAIGIDNGAELFAYCCGISAAVRNSDNVFDNTLRWMNYSQLAALVGEDLRQTLGGAQSNAVTNIIEIVNRGPIDPFEGILATIENFDLTLSNYAGSRNYAYADVNGNVRQSNNTVQSNVVINSIAADNRSDIVAVQVGLFAGIRNEGLDIGSNVSISNLTGPVTIGGDLTQTSTASQTNRLVNDILAINSGSIVSDQYGMLAEIYNDDIDFGYIVGMFNGNRANVGGNLAMINRSTVLNEFTNTIRVVNAGGVDAAVTAIGAIIDNSDFEMTESNSVDSDNNVSPGGTFTEINVDDRATRMVNHIDIDNSGSAKGGYVGIDASIANANFLFYAVPTTSIVNRIDIANSGSTKGGFLGIRAAIANNSDPSLDPYTTNSITIRNTGTVTADTLLAIETFGAPTTIDNMGGGVITGFVGLTQFDDLFVNRQSGRFEARYSSEFGDGFDVFHNDKGGVVHAVKHAGIQPFFFDLERFENKGTVSMVDGNTDDVFTLAPCGCSAVEFVGNSGSTLAVDAFLGAPNASSADNFVIDGNVSGKTALSIHNVNPGPGVFNPQGIPVVFVTGNVNANNFYLPQPFDSGLFDWDLYFVPTGSGFFELRSFPGGGAHVLPQLLTAAQDVFHTTNETWLDRTADLRVLLNGGVPYGAGSVTPQGTAFTPAVWFKGSASWFDQEDSGTTRAYGQTYRYNLNRELDVANFQGGIDFGKRGMWAKGDALVFGILGGAVEGGLDYDKLIRKFDIEGGEAGAYLTYLNGGLFVDTLAKADFLEFDTNHAPGLPGTLDATAWGFRTDAGYRFGGYRQGPFIEPQATIAVAWSELDDFSLGGNTVKFNDETDVRGRLGVRVGTSRPIFPEIVMEPFVIGSLWGHLSGENSATVTSLGTRFGPFTDAPDDLWGVVSTGVNFFSPGTQTALFAKLDVTFGDEVDGLSAKGGMRYNW